MSSMRWWSRRGDGTPASAPSRGCGVPRSLLTRGADTADLVLTAGSASTDPQDPFFTAIDALGGRIVRRGVPSHPGSMLWLARVGGAAGPWLPPRGAGSKGPP